MIMREKRLKELKALDHNKIVNDYINEQKEVE